MATVVKTIGSGWTLIALDTENFYLSKPGRSIEVATVATQTTPTIAFGHPVSSIPHEGANRYLVGSGFVYAKSLTGDVEVALSTWAAD